MKKKAFALFAALVLILTLPVTALANAAEPPRLSVVVLNPPKDLELSLVFTLGDEMEPVEAEAQQLAWEGYYLFRPASFPDRPRSSQRQCPATAQHLCLLSWALAPR